jgi:hypothetical protein
MMFLFTVRHFELPSTDSGHGPGGERMVPEEAMNLIGSHTSLGQTSVDTSLGQWVMTVPCQRTGHLNRNRRMRGFVG